MTCFPWRSGNREGENGQSLIFVAIVLPIVLLIVGLAIGAGDALVQYRSASDAADLSALVGAQKLPCTAATCGTPEALACQTAQQNGMDSCAVHGTASNFAHVPPVVCSPYNFIDYNNPGTCPKPTATPAATPSATPSTTATSYGYIEVGLTKNVQIPIFNVNIPLYAHAVATRGQQVLKCAVCVMSTANIACNGGGGLNISGGASLAITGADVVVNDPNTSTGAICTSSGSSFLTADNIDVMGSINATGGSQINGNVVHPASPMPDPFPGLPTPSCSPPTQAPTGPGPFTYSGGNFQLTNGTATIYPGSYGSIIVSGGVLTLSPGIYCITDSAHGLTVSGGHTIIGSGVMLYFGCGTYTSVVACTSTGQKGGTMNISGGSIYQLSAMTSGTYAGMLIFFDRHNTSPLILSGGSANASSTGTVYAMSAPTTLSGGSSGQVYNDAFVVSTLNITGGSTVSVTEDISTNYQAPSVASLIQ